MIWRAKTVLPLNAPPIADGAVAVEGGQIVAVGPVASITAAWTGPVNDLGEVILLPGLINAHCHLDYGCVRGQVPYTGRFIDWILQIVALKKTKSLDDYRQSIREGIDELLRNGTTTVVNCEAVPELIPEFLGAALPIIWCVELIDLNRTEETEELFQRTEAFLDEHPALVGHYGFAPHAPYTASAGLYALAAKAADARGVLLTTHLAESEEEDDMFRRGSGHMYDHFRRAGRDMSDCKRVSPVQLLAELGVLGPRCLAVHVNAVTPLDTQILKQTGTPVVHCPSSHRFFRRGTPLLKLFQQAGLEICLGTDSLASNDQLNLFAEMQTLAHEIPELDAETILAMVTRNPARALGRVDQLGVLAPGATANLITVAEPPGQGDPYESVVYNESPVCRVIINGQVVVE